MAVRSNMQAAIDYLRQHGQASETDEYLTVTYWTDQQLQDILDRNSYRFSAVLVLLTRDKLTVTARLPRFHYADIDTVVWYDDSNSIVIPSVTYNFERNEWLLTAATTATYIEAAYSDMYEALADLWGQKASQRWELVNFKAGNNRTDLEQEYQHCLDRQSYYRNRVIRRFKR